MTDRLPEITLSGSPAERGFQHGPQLRNRVEQVIEFYTHVLGKPENELFRLAARSHPELPIHRPYIPDDELGEVGTVCSIVMDLPGRTICVKKGNTVATDFVTYSVRKD